MAKFKFEIEQIVKHRAFAGWNDKMIVTGRAEMEFAEGMKENVYIVSFARSVDGNGGRAYLSEVEIEAAKTEE